MSCSSQRETKPVSPPVFGEFVQGIVATSDGNAYLYDSDGVWYLNGAQAVKVHEVSEWTPVSDTEIKKKAHR